MVCYTCSDNSMLIVDGTPVSALFFTPGTPVDGLPRVPTPPVSAARSNNLALYLEDQSNNQAANSVTCPYVPETGGGSGGSLMKGAASCDTYTRPTSTARDRDRIFTVGVASAGTCASNAQMLVDNVPCQHGGSATKPECQTAIDNLDSCTCLTAARTMLQSPCRNTANPPQCQAAIAQLQACTS